MSDLGPAVSARPAVGPTGGAGRAHHPLLFLFLFLMGAETFLVAPLLPRIAADLRTGTGAAAQVVTAYVLTYALAAPFLGALADRVPRRWSIGVGGLVFLTGNVLCAAAGSLGALTAGRAVTGLGGAAAAPALWAYLAETSPAHRRGRTLATGVAGYALGQVLGVPMGALLAQLAGWRWAFLAIAAGLGPLAVVVLVRLPGGRPGPRGPLLAGFAVWRERRVRRSLLATGALQAGRLGAYTFVGVLFARRFGFDTGQLGLLGLLAGAGALTGSLAGGQVVDLARARGRPEGLAAAGWALLFAAAAAVGLTAGRPGPALAALFVWSAAGGAFYTTQQTGLGGLDPGRRAALLSWNSTFDHLGAAVGTVLLSLLPLAGPAFVLTAVGLGLLAALLAAGSRPGRGGVGGRCQGRLQRSDGRRCGGG
ncbi:MFS transporter [Kitasatospora sp. NBC_00374]|uniref:MFS transporter n=1 Tax=Kitasatospora sp. NBC_00374 TaxID=2975964 RepID=UPI003255967F